MAKKPTPPIADTKPKRRLPDNLTPEVAQAVLEDAVLEAAADIAALTASLGGADALVPETPEEEELLELIGVPYLGPARVQALASAGIKTMDDLQSATPDQIGGVKGVGMRNAERIKEWLADQSAEVTTPAPVAESAPVPVTDGLAADSLDPALASLNQDVQDLFARLDTAARILKAGGTAKSDGKRLARQIERLDGAASGLAEGPDTLSPKQITKALKTLEKIVALLEQSAGSGKLSPKKQDTLADTVRESRKGLEKTLAN